MHAVRERVDSICSISYNFRKNSFSLHVFVGGEGGGVKFDWKIFFIRVDFSFGATLVSLVDFLRSHSLCKRSEGHLSSNFPLIAVENSLLFLIYFVRNDYRIRRIFFIYISRVDVVRGSLSQWFFRSSTAAFAFFCVSHDIRDIFNSFELEFMMFMM